LHKKIQLYSPVFVLPTASTVTTDSENAIYQ